MTWQGNECIAAEQRNGLSRLPWSSAARILVESGARRSDISCPSTELQVTSGNNPSRGPKACAFSGVGTTCRSYEYLRYWFPKDDLVQPSTEARLTPRRCNAQGLRIPRTVERPQAGVVSRTAYSLELCIFRCCAFEGDFGRNMASRSNIPKV